MLLLLQADSPNHCTYHSAIDSKKLFHQTFLKAIRFVYSIDLPIHYMFLPALSSILVFMFSLLFSFHSLDSSTKLSPFCSLILCSSICITRFFTGVRGFHAWGYRSLLASWTSSRSISISWLRVRWGEDGFIALDCRLIWEIFIVIAVILAAHRAS